MDQDYRLALKPGAAMAEAGPDQITVQGPETGGAPRATLTFKQLSPALRAALSRLAGEGGGEGELGAAVMEEDGPTGLFKLNHFLQRLSDLRLLSRTVTLDERPLATLVPLTEHGPAAVDGSWGERRSQLSRFALLRREGAALVLESPLAPARVVLHGTLGGTLAAALGQPRDAVSLAEAAGVPAETAGLLLGLLGTAGALTAVDAAGQAAEDAGAVMPQWEFHDLFFHSRSRVGRHGSPVGGVYPFVGRIEPLPALKPAPEGPRLDLFRPDLAALTREDRPFTAVLEERRSIREQGEAPLSAAQLGEFLYRCARVTEMYRSDQGELARRPYPGGGAIWELEVYPVVDRVEGVPSGLYHYEPLEHQLTRIPGGDEGARALLEMAYHTIERRSRPQVLLVFAARFQRIQWKYRSVSYAVILKDVGVLQQTMYLVATAMGLAGCALGGGNADLFAGAAGLDYYAETSVGEFVLGTRGDR